MNWREEPLTFPQECSNMCLAHFKCTSVHFKFLKTTTLPPKYLESDSMAIVFWDTTKMLSHYCYLSSIHTIIHFNNWTLLFIFISFLISHVTNPLHLRARSVLFVSKKGMISHTSTLFDLASNKRKLHWWPTGKFPSAESESGNRYNFFTLEQHRKSILWKNLKKKYI